MGDPPAQDAKKSPAEPPLAIGTKSRGLFVFLGALSLVLATAVYGWSVSHVPDGPGVAVEAFAPARLGDWIKEPTAAGDWRPSFVGSDATILARYRKGDAHADLYLAYYHRQRQGAELVNAANHFADQPPWRRLQGSRASLSALGPGVEVPVLLYGSAGGNRRMVIAWYWVAGRPTGDDVAAKLLQVWATLLGGPSEAAVLVLSAAYEDDTDEALALLRDLAIHLPSPRPLIAPQAAE